MHRARRPSSEDYCKQKSKCIKLSPESRALLDIYVYPNPYFISKPRNTVGKWVHTYNLLDKNLRSNVGKSSTAPLQQAFLALVPEHCRHPKVRHLQVVAIIQEQVFRLDISTKKTQNHWSFLRCWVADPRCLSRIPRSQTSDPTRTQKREGEKFVVL